VSEKRRKKTKS